MTTPIQPALVPPPAAQPAAANPQQSSEWQQFYDWFAHGIVPGSGSTPPAASEQPAAPNPTTPPAASPAPGPLFEASVTGTGPYDSHTTYNCTQFATAETAQRMAQIVGGQEADFTLGGPYTRTSPERDIVGAGANPLNAGLVADLFQKYGDAKGSYAWQVIDRDLGKIQG